LPAELDTDASAARRKLLLTVQGPGDAQRRDPEEAVIDTRDQRAPEPEEEEATSPQRKLLLPVRGPGDAQRRDPEEAVIDTSDQRAPEPEPEEATSLQRSGTPPPRERAATPPRKDPELEPDEATSQNQNQNQNQKKLLQGDPPPIAPGVHGGTQTSEESVDNKDYRSWAKHAVNDPVCLLRWANVWDTLDVDHGKKDQLTEVQGEKITQATQIREVLLKHREPALVTTFALIQADVLHYQGHRQRKGQRKVYAQAERRLLHKLATNAVSQPLDSGDNVEELLRAQEDVCRYTEEITTHQIFETFVQPLLSMFLEEPLFKIDLVYWLASDTCRTALAQELTNNEHSYFCRCFGSTEPPKFWDVLDKARQGWTEGKWNGNAWEKTVGDNQRAWRHLLDAAAAAANCGSTAAAAADASAAAAGNTAAAGKTDANAAAADANTTAAAADANADAMPERNKYVKGLITKIVDNVTGLPVVSLKGQGFADLETLAAAELSNTPPPEGIPRGPGGPASSRAVTPRQPTKNKRDGKLADGYLPAALTAMQSAINAQLDHVVKALVEETTLADGWIQTSAERPGRTAQATHGLLERTFAADVNHTCVISGKFENAAEPDKTDHPAAAAARAAHLKLERNAVEPDKTVPPYFNHLEQGNPSYAEEFRKKVELNKDVDREIQQDLSLCTHLILFKKGKCDTFLHESLTHQLQQQQAKDHPTEPIRRVVIMLGGDEKDLGAAVEEVEKLSVDVAPLIVPMIGLGGAAHYLGCIVEAAAKSNKSASFGSTIYGAVPKTLTDDVNNLLSSMPKRRNAIQPIDLSDKLDSKELQEVVNEALWGVDYGDLEDVLRDAWATVLSKERKYTARIREAVITYVVIFVLTSAITVLGVLDSSQSEIMRMQHEQAMQLSNLTSNGEDAPPRTEYWPYLIILPAVAGFALGLQHHRRALVDAAKEAVTSAMIQGQIYKLRTGTGDYTAVPAKCKQLFVRNCKEIESICGDVRMDCSSIFTDRTHDRENAKTTAIRDAIKRRLLFQPHLGLDSLVTFEVNCFPYTGTSTFGSNGPPPHSSELFYYLQLLRHVRSKIRVIWDATMVAAAVVLFVLEVSGATDSADELCILTQKGFPGGLGVMLVFGADMLLCTLSTGVRDESRHIGDPQSLLKNAWSYLWSGWFALDLVALFPWCVLDAGRADDSPAMKENPYGTNLASLRMLRVTRLLRLIRTTQHLNRVLDTVFAANSNHDGVLKGGDDGVSRLTGPQYQRWRLEPLKTRFRTSAARGDFIHQACQHGATALALTGTALSAFDHGRWVVVTAWLGSAAIATLTFFKIHTVAEATKAAYLECNQLDTDLVNNKPIDVHELVRATEEAACRETAAWALAVAKGSQADDEAAPKAPKGEPHEMRRP
jgi:hypothetical protein